VNYGLRWEAQIQPDPITPPDEVFFAPFIGQSVTNAQGTFEFPSDGKMPSDWRMFQPRLGIAWDVHGDGREVVRGSAGVYYARVPGLVLASTRSTNGSIGQTLFRNSALTGVLGPPPTYGQLLPAPSGVPFAPGVFVFDQDFRNPRTLTLSAGYEREVATGFAVGLSFQHSRTDFLTRFVNQASSSCVISYCAEYLASTYARDSSSKHRRENRLSRGHAAIRRGSTPSARDRSTLMRCDFGL